jgi:hypothetical protein
LVSILLLRKVRQAIFLLIKQGEGGLRTSVLALFCKNAISNQTLFPYPIFFQLTESPSAGFENKGDMTGLLTGSV